MKERLILLAMIAGLFAVLCLQYRRTEKMTAERDRYRGNTEVLLGECETFRVRDSLSAARVKSLELTCREYEALRADDAALIRELKARNRELVEAERIQAQTIIELSAVPDTVIVVRDSIVTPALSLHCGDEWFDFRGWLMDGKFEGALAYRDSLLCAETVRYRRFLGFLWKTKQVKDREIEIVSKSPYTEIKGIEFINIKK